MALRRLNWFKYSKKILIKIIRTKKNSVFGVSDIYGVKLPTRFRLNSSPLNEHMFRHNFNDTINPICNCGAATETTIDYILRRRLYSFQRAELLDGVYKLDSTLPNSLEDQLLTVLWYGSEKYALNVNKEIIRLTISFLKASERFVQPLFWLTTFVFIYSFIYFLSFFTYLFIYLLIYSFIFIF